MDATKAHYLFLEDLWLTVLEYCRVFNLSYRVAGEHPMTDEDWEETLCAGFDPRYIDEMTPICYIALQDDNTISIVTGEDESGDVTKEFTKEQVEQAIRNKTPLHRTDN